MFERVGPSYADKWAKWTKGIDKLGGQRYMIFEASRHTSIIELKHPHPAGNPTLEVVEWSARFGSELVLCDGEGAPLLTLAPETPALDVDFTAFVSWDGFNAADVHLIDAGHERYLSILEHARAALREYVENRTRERATKIIRSRRRKVPALVG
ncbi:hypothetical protein QTQ03_04605 [Micromonospora sp. WMMA1363]|uniref:hypothetical protein n=1 Tax=Micromonospora sp. WMMA1363 TaxID=3053985 RepID=UPI00259C9EE6|nr:hypothetical protein [Micromonospora sp. WMMA1363]MDM4718912.1 hypothetical protein [Micromonospora sp. WMMA1363]